MGRGKHTPIEEMELFRRYVDVANWVWKTVRAWDILARDTVGKQMIRAADSVGANLVEGDGRYMDADALHFFVIARASARETRYWIRLAQDRELIPAAAAVEKIGIVSSATQLLNRLIAYRRQRDRKTVVAEQRLEYRSSQGDPFTDWELSDA
jgi:four helix bundle protein